MNGLLSVCVGAQRPFNWLKGALAHFAMWVMAWPPQSVDTNIAEAMWDHFDISKQTNKKNDVGELFLKTDIFQL